MQPGTSKYHASHADANEAPLGCHGTFLASLAAMSLLTVASQHHQHRSHNAVTFHHSKAVERLLPASANHQLHGKHSTRVTVRNLFGNLPVRVKQRSLVLQQKSEQDRLWEGLKREIVGLLLSWAGFVSVRVRDGDNRVIFSLNTVTHKSRNADKPGSARLTSMLNVLTQASFISVADWPNWIPLSASTAHLSIKGAVSLDPAPSRHAQFISLGIRPVSAESGSNELYDEINRLFALSSFGTIEDDANVDDLEKLRRQGDKRFKTDEYTHRQLKARKDVDRHPSFHLRITIKGEQSLDVPDRQLGDNGSNLQAVMELLRAMITEWLSVHHFRPRKSQGKRIRPSTASTVLNDRTANSLIPTTYPAIPTVKTKDAYAHQPATGSSSANGKRRRPSLTKSHSVSARSDGRAFAEWSRIKSGNLDFFKDLPSLPKGRPGTGSKAWHGNFTSRHFGGNREGFASFQVEPLLRGALSTQAAFRGDETPSEAVDRPQHQQDAQDDTILWTDPTTTKTHLLNARTGSVMSDVRPRPNTDPVVPTLRGTRNGTDNSVRLAKRTATVPPGATPWLNGILETWNNPVFLPNERRIQQVDLHEPGVEGRGHRHPAHHCSRSDIDKAFNQVSIDTKSGRLSKESLQSVKVIAQVDRKFILVKMKQLSVVESAKEATTDVLVLIDQHAADERIRVEALSKELCTPITLVNGHSGYQSKLGHKALVASVLLERPIQFTVSHQEHAHFTTHAARFAAWGILFDCLSSTSTNRPSTSKNKQHLLSVTTLPPSISQRCNSDPKILISFLRSTLWTYVSASHLPPPSSTTTPSSDWIRRLATCPPGLIDMLNSRACRSAIMFNDALSLEACEALVGRLAACVFPFMCAHGRPSMVPVLGLGGGSGSMSINMGVATGKVDGYPGETSFIRAWKAWNR